jgi:hypothetical protein
VLGAQRRCLEHRGTALASPATLNRLELGARHADYYRKLHAAPDAVEAALLKLGVRCLPRDAQVLVLDFDAIDDPLHGREEGRLLPAPSGAALRANAPPFGCLAPLGSTATTSLTAACRCFAFAAMCVCGRSCAPPTATAATAPSMRWRKSWPPSANVSRTCRASSAPTAGLRASQSWRGARRSATCFPASAWPATRGFEFLEFAIQFENHLPLLDVFTLLEAPLIDDPMHRRSQRHIQKRFGNAIHHLRTTFAPPARDAPPRARRITAIEQTKRWLLGMIFKIGARSLTGWNLVC